MPTSDLPLYKSSDCSHLDLKERASRSETATRVAAGVSTAMTVGITACSLAKTGASQGNVWIQPKPLPSAAQPVSVEDADFELYTEDVNTFRAKCEVNGMRGRNMQLYSSVPSQRLTKCISCANQPGLGRSYGQTLAFGRFCHRTAIQ